MTERTRYARDVICPRCEGGGIAHRVATYNESNRLVGYRDVPCFLCGGTGKASLLEPLREPRAPNREPL